MPASPSRGGQALSSGVSAGTLLISPLQNPSAILQPAPCPAPVPIMARRSRHTVSAALYLTAKNRLAFQAAAGDGHARACLGKTWRGPSCPSGWLKGIWTGHISCSASATEAISVLTFPWCFTRAGPSPQPAAALGRQRGFLQAAPTSRARPFAMILFQNIVHCFIKAHMKYVLQIGFCVNFVLYILSNISMPKSSFSCFWNLWS